MTVEESALMAAILDQPAEDLHRLAYADWLDENGQQDRAEFIRVQIELARGVIGSITTPPSHDRGCQRKAKGRCRAFSSRGSCGRCIALEVMGTERRRAVALQKRERHLWDEYGAGFGLDIDGLAPKLRWMLCEPGSSVARVIRGFVGGIACSSDYWLSHAEAILDMHPIELVTLRTTPRLDVIQNFPSRPGRRCLLPGRNSIVPWHDGEHRNDAAHRVLKAEWPRIVFTLPLVEFRADDFSDLDDLLVELRNASVPSDDMVDALP